MVRWLFVDYSLRPIPNNTSCTTHCMVRPYLCAEFPICFSHIQAKPRSFWMKKSTSISQNELLIARFMCNNYASWCGSQHFASLLCLCWTICKSALRLQVNRKLQWWTPVQQCTNNDNVQSHMHVRSTSNWLSLPTPLYYFHSLTSSSSVFVYCTKSQSCS